MFSFIVAVIVAIWFFVSAQAQQKTGWQWALIGGASYFGVATIVGNLAFLMIGPIRVDDLPQTVISVIAVSLSIAFVVVLLIYRQFLRKGPADESADTNIEVNSSQQPPRE